MTSPFVRAFTEGNPLYEKYHQVQQPCTPSPALSSFCYYHHHNNNNSNQHLQVSPPQQEQQQQPSSAFSYSFCNNNSNTTPSHHLLTSSSSSVFQNVENATVMSVSPYQHQQNNYNTSAHHQQATLPPHCCCANQEQEVQENHDDEDDETSSVLNIVHKNVKKTQYTNAKPYHNSIDLDDKEGEHRGDDCDDLDVDDDDGEEEDDNITIFTTSVFTNKLRQNNNNKKSVSFSKHHHQELLEDDFDHEDQEQDHEEVENEDDAEYWQNNEEYQYPTYRDDQIPHELDHTNNHDHHQNFVASSLPQHPFAHFGTSSPYSSPNHQPAVASPSTTSVRCHNPYAHMKKEEEQQEENPQDDHTTMRIHELLSSRELNIPFLPSCTPLQFDSLRNFVLQHQPAKALSNLDSTESSYVRLFVGRVNKSITGNQLRLLFWLFAGVSIQGFEIAQQDVKPYNNCKKRNKTTNKNHHHQHHHKTSSSSSREDADAAYVWVHPYDVARCLRLLHKKVLIDQNGFFYAKTKREVAILHIYGSALGRNLHHHQSSSSSPREQNSVLLNSYLRKAIIFCRPRQTITVTVSRDGEDKKYFEDYISPLCSCEFCHNFYENNDNDGQNEEYNSYQIQMEEFHTKLLSFYNQQQQQHNIENVKVLRFSSIQTIIDSHSNINGNAEKLSEKMLQYSHENTQLYFFESNLLSEENIQQLQHHRQGNSSSSCSFPCSWIECKYSHHNSNFVRPPLPSL